VRVSFCDKPSPPIVAGIRHFTIAMPLPQRINDLNPDTWILAIDSQQAFQHVKRSSRFIPETGKVLALTLQQVLSPFIFFAAGEAAQAAGLQPFRKTKSKISFCLKQTMGDHGTQSRGPDLCSWADRHKYLNFGGFVTFQHATKYRHPRVVLSGIQWEIWIPAKSMPE
jgi:hypothetical protein